MHRWDGFKVRAVGKRGWRRKWGERTWRQGKQRIVSSKGHGKGRATPQSNYCLSLSTNVFLSLFLVVLVWLLRALWLSLVFVLCKSACAPASMSHGMLSGCQAQSCHTLTEHAHPTLSLTHTHSQTCTHTYTQLESRLDWATDRTKHGLTAVPAFPLKGLITGLHHIWNSK